MTPTVEGSAPPPTTHSRWRRWRLLAAAAVVIVLLLAVLTWWFFLRVDLGTATRRAASPTGEYEVVQYEFTAVIDPGWNLVIERVEGDGREWFWRSVEGPAPAAINFVGPTSVELTDEDGGAYRIDFDRDSLKPNKRFCLRPEYCHSAPWDEYTHDGP